MQTCYHNKWSEPEAEASKERQPSTMRCTRRLGGRLIYLYHTRMNIAYSVDVNNQFMHNPKKVHLQTTYWVLNYLKGTPPKSIIFIKEIPDNYWNSILIQTTLDQQWVEEKQETEYGDLI